MAHFPSRFVYRSHSMALVSLHPSAPVQEGHLHMGIAVANTLLHCSSHGMSSRKRSPKWTTSIPSWNDTEEAYPRASIDLYQQHVERLIAGRGRSNYQVACRYLAKIRSLYEKLDETEQWTTYIAWLRKRHSRLSTLKEELAAAGL